MIEGPEDRAPDTGGLAMLQRRPTCECCAHLLPATAMLAPAAGGRGTSKVGPTVVGDAAMTPVRPG
jgi:hypothetical protein